MKIPSEEIRRAHLEITITGDCKIYGVGYDLHLPAYIVKPQRFGKTTPKIYVPIGVRLVRRPKTSGKKSFDAL